MKGIQNQEGMVLLITLIMIGVFSVIVFSMVTGSNINFKIAGNQQYRVEAKAAARNAIEAYISNPANFQNPLPEGSSEFSSDFDGDGTADMSAIVSVPTCLRVRPGSAVSLSEEFTQCFGSSQSQTPGILGGASGGAGSNWCTNMYWDVMAEVEDAATGAVTVMHQGVYVRAIIGTPCLN